MPAVLLAEPVATVPANVLLEQLQRDGIRTPRLAEVRDYVQRYPDIIPVMQHACTLSVAEFAGKAGLSLEVYVDPEIADPYLTLYVQKEGYDPATSQVIENIFATYAEGMTNSAAWMMVMQDYRGASQDV